MHPNNEKVFFEMFRKHMLKLNPSNHIFMVKLRKLVGFIMRSKDIEDDPNKVKAIQTMIESRIEKKVRSFLGHLNYIARFIF